MIDAGTIIDDKYEIVSVLGVGGFGNVYKALHKQFTRLVAIKVLKTTLLDESDGILRFEREAKSINAIKHKNIVSLYGYGIWQNTPYMVMEFVEGKSLENTLAVLKQLEPEAVPAIMAQLFAGLACAHASGVVHRDLKPSNVMLIPSSDGPASVKIIDFGLAKLMPGYGVSSQKLTETGYALGTCHYMAPEQCLAGSIDQRADIYSAGCILYQCLTGKLPFDADNNVAVMFRHINEQPIPIEHYLGNKPLLNSLQVVLDNCLAKHPDDRYATAAEAQADIERIISGDLKELRRFSAPFAAPSTKLNAEQDLRGVAAVALIAVALLGVFSLFNAFRAAPSSHQDSSELANEVFRKWNGLSPDGVALMPKFEAILAADSLDHQLTPERRLKTAQWLALFYTDAKEVKKRDRQIAEALRLRLSVPRKSRQPRDELNFASTLDRADRTDQALTVLYDLHAIEGDYPNAPWEVEHSRINECEILIFHGHLTSAEQRIRKRMLSELGSVASVRFRCLLGDIAMQRKNYGAAYKMYLEATDTPHPYPSITFAALTRSAIYNNKNDLAAQYMERACQLCKEDFPDKPCETIVMLQIIIAARQNDYARCKQLVTTFGQEQSIHEAGTRYFEDSDRQLCVTTLKSAGYNDLIKLLGTYARPHLRPRLPLVARPGEASDIGIDQK